MTLLERDRERARQRLEQIRRQTPVPARGGTLRAAVFGANDGLVSNVSLVVGVAAAEPGRDFILLAGIAGLVAGAFSMAAGEYISMRVQREVFEHALTQERAQLEADPGSERDELEVILQAKGIPPPDASRLADVLIADPPIALDMMAREELQINPDDLGSPLGAAVSSLLSFATGAILPVLPYLLLDGWDALLLSIAISGAALVGLGLFTARLGGRHPLFGGLRQLLIGGLAAGITFLVGRLVGVGML